MQPESSTSFNFFQPAPVVNLTASQQLAESIAFIKKMGFVMGGMMVFLFFSGANSRSDWQLEQDAVQSLQYANTEHFLKSKKIEFTKSAQDGHDTYQIAAFPATNARAHQAYIIKKYSDHSTLTFDNLERWEIKGKISYINNLLKDENITQINSAAMTGTTHYSLTLHIANW